LLDAPVWLRGNGRAELAPGSPVFAVAGIARPERFAQDLRAAGYVISGSMGFRDHHWFTAADVRRIEDAARRSGAIAVLVTDKDAVRIDERLFTDPPAARVPLTVVVEPSFLDWLLVRVREAREGARIGTVRS
jgi:tetraacyldisaccharide-1-P 4'-kinase